MEQSEMERVPSGKSQSETDTLLEPKRRVTLETAKSLRMFTLVKSWLEALILGALGVLTLIVSVYENSPASFGFAMCSLLDVISACVVIWRFSYSSKLYSARLDRIACLVLGILFILAGILVILKSSYTLIDAQYPKLNNIVYYYSVVNGTISTMLAIIEVSIAFMLESLALATDAINTVVNVIFAFTILISNAAFQHNVHVWYLDAVVGIVCSLFLVGYGFWIVVYECHVNQIPDDSDY